MTDTSDKTKVSEKSWVPLGATATIAAATGGGGFATAMWIMSTLYGVKDDVNTSALQTSKEVQAVQINVDKLSQKFDDLARTNDETLKKADFENWVLRFSLANRDVISVPAVENK